MYSDMYRIYLIKEQIYCKRHLELFFVQNSNEVDKITFGHIRIEVIV